MYLIIHPYFLYALLMFINSLKMIKINKNMSGSMDRLYKYKTTFIVPTDAHYYKIIEMLKQF